MRGRTGTSPMVARESRSRLPVFEVMPPNANADEFETMTPARVSSVPWLSENFRVRTTRQDN